MEEWRRHAVYFAPPAGSPLARFGADWLGWDAEAGVPRPGLDLPGLPRPHAELVAGPDRYGFHATLKPPFRLAGGRKPAELEAAIATLALRIAPFELKLALGELFGFVALHELRPVPALAALADACVTELDDFRAPPTAVGIARRGTNLDPVEAANLAQWGYPYVFDRFRFHMTLTCNLPPEEVPVVSSVLAEPLAPLLTAPVPVRELCHFAEGEDGRFRLLGRYPLNRGNAHEPERGSASPSRND